MKYITFAVPSYNSQDYLHNAIDSLLIVGKDAEIIIINDGSKDGTLDIARKYASLFPNIVKVIDKKNGGHGSGVNAGLEMATGLYYKVVDSDDWLDHENIVTFVDTIKKHHKEGVSPDLYINDFKYEHVEDNTSYVRSYVENFTENEIFSWSDNIKKFKGSKTMLMHALTFKTSVLKESKVVLPEHTFYVDNIYGYVPLPFVKTIYYSKDVLYHYFIGRADQSITIKNIIARYDQQIRVMNIILNEFSYEEIKRMPKGLKSYIKHFLSATMIVTQMFTIGENTKERKLALKKVWKDLKTNDKKMYNYLMYRSYNTLVNFLPWRLKSYVLVKGYKYYAKKVKLG